MRTLGPKWSGNRWRSISYVHFFASSVIVSLTSDMKTLYSGIIGHFLSHTHTRSRHMTD